MISMITHEHPVESRSTTSDLQLSEIGTKMSPMKMDKKQPSSPPSDFQSVSNFSDVLSNRDAVVIKFIPPENK